MPQTIRKYWAPQQGRVVLNYPWNIINQNSVVLVTAAECTAETPTSNDHRFIGDASVTVESIAPYGPPNEAGQGVRFVVNVEWSSPLPIATDITVLDAPPSLVVPYTPPPPPVVK